MANYRTGIMLMLRVWLVRTPPLKMRERYSNHSVCLSICLHNVNASDGFSHFIKLMHDDVIPSYRLTYVGCDLVMLCSYLKGNTLNNTTNFKIDYLCLICVIVLWKFKMVQIVFSIFCENIRFHFKFLYENSKFHMTLVLLRLSSILKY